VADLVVPLKGIDTGFLSSCTLCDGAHLRDA
jgi:hypothetical protein